MIKILFLIVLAAAQAYPQQGRLIPNPLKGIPRWARAEFKAHHLDRNYTITFRLYPHYYKADFNGDSRKDFALQITENSSGKSGILILHGKKPQAISTFYTILGAGKSVGRAGDDFKWVKNWVLNKSPRNDELKLNSGKEKKGRLRWNSSSYVWESDK